MKIIVSILLGLLCAGGSYGQQVLYLNEEITTHILSPLPVLLSDLSTAHVVFAQPAATIIQLKAAGSYPDSTFLGVASLVTRDAFTQYELYYASNATADRKAFSESGSVALLPYGDNITRQEMKEISSQWLTAKKPKSLLRRKIPEMNFTLNTVAMSSSWIGMAITLASDVPTSIQLVRVQLQTTAHSSDELEILYLQRLKQPGSERFILFIPRKAYAQNYEMKISFVDVTGESHEVRFPYARIYRFLD